MKKHDDVWWGVYCVWQDYIDTEALLSNQNVNQEALLSYAREAADYATHYQLPSLEYANNHLEQQDVAMFDFTCMYASENAALVRERFGHQLLVTLVGDSLLEVSWHRLNDWLNIFYVFLWEVICVSILKVQNSVVMIVK